MAITRILDEADIAEAFVRHTAAYVSHHVFVDNGSRDGTLEILRALKEEGFGITVFQNAAVSFNEIHFNTTMLHHAARECQADWVLCLDSDEFIDDRDVDGGLSEALQREIREHPDSLCLQVPLIEYETAPDDDHEERIVPLRLRRRAGAHVCMKVFMRSELARPGVSVAAGNHSVEIDGEWVPQAIMPGLRLAHYARRSPYQAAVKCAKGWAKVLAAGPDEVGRYTNAHYTGHFALLRDRPQDYFHNPETMRPPEANLALILDPIAYRGGALRYSDCTDEPMRAIRRMMGYLDELATCHGRLLDEVPEARARTDTWNRELTRII